MMVARFVLVAFVAACVATGCQDRDRMSKTEAKQTAAELTQMLKDSDVSDASTFNTAVDPKSRIGQKVKEMIEKRQAIEKEYEIRTAGVDPELLLAPQQLARPEGVRRSRADIAKLKAADEWLILQGDALTDEFVRWAIQEFGQNKSAIEKLRSERNELVALTRALYRAFEDVLDFVDAKKPKLDDDGDGLRFATDTDNGRFVALVRAVENKANVLDTRRQEILQGRQEAMQRVTQQAPK